MCQEESLENILSAKRCAYFPGGDHAASWTTSYSLASRQIDVAWRNWFTLRLLVYTQQGDDIKTTQPSNEQTQAPPTGIRPRYDDAWRMQQQPRDHFLKYGWDDGRLASRLQLWRPHVLHLHQIQLPIELIGHKIQDEVDVSPAQRTGLHGRAMLLSDSFLQ